MSLGEAIYAACLAHAPLKGLVGTRIYPLTAPTDIDGPHIIWQGVTSTPATTMDGPAAIGYRMFQFACYADTYERAAAVRSALIDALDNVQLDTGDRPTLDDDNRDDKDEQSTLYRCDVDFLI